MRAALVGPYFFPQVYRIDKVMYKHAIHLAALGHEVRVLTSSLQYPAGRYADLPQREERDGITIWRLPVFVRSLGRAVAYLTNGGIVIRGLGRRLRAIDPEVIHAHKRGGSELGGRCGPIRPAAGTSLLLLAICIRRSYGSRVCARPCLEP